MATHRLPIISHANLQKRERCRCYENKHDTLIVCFMGNITFLDGRVITNSILLELVFKKNAINGKLTQKDAD